jgi:hypothetical protein
MAPVAAGGDTFSRDPVLLVMAAVVLGAGAAVARKIRPGWSVLKLVDQRLPPQLGDRWRNLTVLQSYLVRYPLGVGIMLFGWFVLHPLWAPLACPVIVGGALIVPWGWRDAAKRHRSGDSLG